MKVLKWLGYVLAGLAGLVIAAAGVLFFLGASQFTRVYEVSPAPVPIPSDSAAVEKGAYLFGASCASCHGDDARGRVVFDDPGLGTFVGSNLTSGEGGVGSYYTDEDFVRAIRHGIRSNGEALAIMPSQAYWHFSDADLGAVIAYIRTFPPADSNWPPRSTTPMGKLLVGAGALDIFAARHIDHDGQRGPVPARGVTSEYGQYLVNTGDCANCHGENLAGGAHPEPGAPPGPNLTPGGPLSEWSDSDFVAAIRTGTTPAGKELDPRYMPWQDYARLNDEDLSAMFVFLQSLAPLEDAAILAAK